MSFNFSRLGFLNKGSVRALCFWQVMMTSSNGNICRVTAPLYGEFTVHRWIPLTRAGDAELWFFSFICAWKSEWVKTRDAGDLRRHHAHYDVCVILLYAQHVFVVSRVWPFWNPCQNSKSCTLISIYLWETNFCNRPIIPKILEVFL